MINILELTRAQRNLAAVEAPIVRIEARMKASVDDLNEAYHAMWGLSDAEIEEIVNSKSLEWFEGLLTQHATNAAMFNAILAARGITTQQAIIGLPREFTVDPETGVFSLVPLPTPDPVTPDPEPQP